MKNWFAVVNPHAGVERSRKKWDYIEYLLSKEKISFDYLFTAYRMHAVEIVRKAIKEGYKKFIAVGGDGTVNEVVNGIFKSKNINPRDYTIAMIEVGTGNDWGKTLGIPRDYKKSIKLIKEEKIVTQDVGLVKYYKKTNRYGRYFVNVAGMGFDAQVAMRTNLMKDKLRGYKFLYLWNLFVTLLKYNSKHAVVEIDGEKKADGKVLSMNTGIGKYSGGKMQFTPEAVYDDGLFDFTMINDVKKLEIIKNLSRVYNGTLLDYNKVDSFKGKTIKIRSKDKIYLEVDGESLGHTPFEFSIIPDILNVVSIKGSE